MPGWVSRTLSFVIDRGSFDGSVRARRDDRRQMSRVAKAGGIVVRPLAPVVATLGYG